MQGFKYKKAIQALNFLSKKSGGNLNKMKALNMIWLSDRYHLRQYGRTITNDVYFALPYGPVASTTRDILEKNGLSSVEAEYSDTYLRRKGYEFHSIKEVEEQVFSQTDLNTLILIYDKYGQLNEFEISELSHKFPEWSKYENALKSTATSRYEIEYNDFFENIDDGRGLFNDDSDFLSISKEIFNDNIKSQW